MKIIKKIFAVIGILLIAGVSVLVIANLSQDLSPEQSSANFEYGLIAKQKSESSQIKLTTGDRVDVEVLMLAPQSDQGNPESAEVVIEYNPSQLEFVEISEASDVLMIGPESDPTRGRIIVDFVKQGQGGFVGDSLNLKLLATASFTLRSSELDNVKISFSSDSKVGDKMISQLNADEEFSVVVSGSLPVCGNSNCESGETLICPQDCKTVPTPLANNINTPEVDPKCSELGINYASVVPVGDNWHEKAQSLGMGYTLEIVGNSEQKLGVLQSFRAAMARGLTPILRICYGSYCSFSNVNTYINFVNDLADELENDGTFYIIAGPNEPLSENWLGNIVGDPISTAQKITPYMNAVIDGVNKPNVKILSPVFNTTNDNFPFLVSEMKMRGAKFNQLDGIAGNAYNLKGYSLGETLSDFVTRMRAQGFSANDIYLTEVGAFESDKNNGWTGTKVPHQEALQNLRNEIVKLRNDNKVKAYLLFNSFGTNSDSNFDYNVFSDDELNYLVGPECVNEDNSPSSTPTATPSPTISSVPLCRYLSTQARVQRSVTEPWVDNLEISCEESFSVGSFHDNNGQFANDTIITVIDPQNRTSNLKNGDSFRTSVPGDYRVVVTTNGQEGVNCRDEAKVSCSSTTTPTPCPIEPVCSAGYDLVTIPPFDGVGCTVYECVPSSTTFTCQSDRFVDSFSAQGINNFIWKTSEKGGVRTANGHLLISVPSGSFQNNYVETRSFMQGNFQITADIVGLSTDYKNSGTAELGVGSPLGHAHLGLNQGHYGKQYLEANIRIGENWLGSRTLDLGNVKPPVKLIISRFGSTVSMSAEYGGTTKQVAIFNNVYLGNVNAQLYSFTKDENPAINAAFDNYTYGCSSDPGSVTGVPTPVPPTPRPTCPVDLKVCPSGFTVSRDPFNNCEFRTCPIVSSVCGNNICETDEEINKSCSIDCAPTVTPTPTQAPKCTSHEYTQWSECINGYRTRKLISSLPEGCKQGVSPIFGEVCGSGSLICTTDTKACDDGTWVSRDPSNNCEFMQCPGQTECVQPPACANPGPGEARCYLSPETNWCSLECEPIPACALDSAEQRCSLAPGVNYCQALDQNSVDEKTANACKADYDGNGTIDINDFAVFAKNYKKENIDCSLDIVNNDCKLDISDFRLLGYIYGQENACQNN